MKKNILKKLEKDEKAISPVVATVIIVAVAIAVAIAVAYWVTGLVPAFTRYEELKVQSCYVDDADTATIIVRNTGSADATIDNVLVNARLPTEAFTEVTLEPGDETTITVLSVNYADLVADGFQSGVIYDFQVHSAAGGSYPASARAP
jgi:flagellin-like protein